MADKTENKAKSSQVNKAEIAYRRRLVGSLYLAHVGQEEIARRLKVDQSTVSRDIKTLKKLWMTEAVGDIQEFVIRELAELNEMENQAAIEFGQKDGKSPRWITARLQIKQMKYLLLGFNKRTIELTGKVQVESIEDVRAKRWKDVQPSLAEMLFEQAAVSNEHGNESIISLLQSYNTNTIESEGNGNDEQSGS